MKAFLEFLEMIGVGLLALSTGIVSAVVVVLIVAAYMLAIASPVILIVWLITRA